MQGTVHKLLQCPKNWENFDEALKINQDKWLKNQFPESWTVIIVNKTIEILVMGNRKPHTPRKIYHWLKRQINLAIERKTTEDILVKCFCYD